MSHLVQFTLKSGLTRGHEQQEAGTMTGHLRHCPSRCLHSLLIWPFEISFSLHSSLALCKLACIFIQGEHRSKMGPLITLTVNHGIDEPCCLNHHDIFLHVWSFTSEFPPPGFDIQPFLLHMHRRICSKTHFLILLAVLLNFTFVSDLLLRVSRFFTLGELCYLAGPEITVRDTESYKIFRQKSPFLKNL